MLNRRVSLIYISLLYDFSPNLKVLPRCLVHDEVVGEDLPLQEQVVEGPVVVGDGVHATTGRLY